MARIGFLHRYNFQWEKALRHFVIRNHRIDRKFWVCSVVKRNKKRHRNDYVWLTLQKRRNWFIKSKQNIIIDTTQLNKWKQVQTYYLHTTNMEKYLRSKISFLHHTCFGACSHLLYWSRATPNCIAVWSEANSDTGYIEHCYTVIL